MRRTPIFLVAIAMAFAVTSAYAANDFTLTDNGWTYIEHNIDKPGNQQAAGQPTNFFFENQGNDIMQQNWWWFRAGGTSELALTNQTSFTQNSAKSVTVGYTEAASNGAPLQFTLNYILTGTSPAEAEVQIDWSVTNTSTTLSTALNVFSYTNTKLLPNPNQQNPSTVGAFSATSDTITVTSNTNPTTITLLAQGAGSSPLAGWRVDDFNDLLDDLTDNAITNFPTTSQSLSSVNAEAGFQWAKTTDLGPGDQTGGILFKQVVAPVIPEPGAVLLAVPGLMSVLALRRRRK